MRSREGEGPIGEVEKEHEWICRILSNYNLIYKKNQTTINIKTIQKYSYDD